MSRREQLLEMMDELNSEGISIEEFKAHMLADIALSLAVIADKLTEEEES